jgi:hypothetical protein
MITRAVARATKRIPALRAVPVLKLLAIAEIVLLIRDHVARLEPHERRRLIELVKLGRGRKRNLSEAEQAELADLLAKTEPRALAGEAVEKLSPVALPRRLVYGRKRR